MRLILSFILSMLPFIARAEVPRVVTDIAPIHSLVAQIMDGVSTPDVLISGAASPHDFQFTFEQADAVQNADLVIWVGSGLTPWLGDALDTLTTEDAKLELLRTEGWPSLDRRQWDQDHGDDEHGDDEHETDALDTLRDPHAWLDPQVAIIWTRQIAAALRMLDPENEATYLANADATIDRLVLLDQDIAAMLADIPRGAFLVPHDAYQYFEVRYNVPAIGTVSLSDANAPDPSHIAELRDLVREQDVVCILSDPQSRPEWVDLVREGSDAGTAVVDPIGTAFPAGPDHYAQTLRAIADGFAQCLRG